jgi:hypothetical protein
MMNVEVELEPNFQRYYLPEPGSSEEIAEAIRQSWELLGVAPLRITAPLLALAYAAPLSEIVAPAFALWLWGGTGSYKSTIAALVLSHFGDFTETDLPFSFESTANALEREMFLAKDVLAVVDDWRPGVTRADSDAMDQKAQRVLRAVGNRQGRNRMSADTTLKASYPPRGAVLATAEALPEGPAFQSAASRSFSVSLAKPDVGTDKLTQLQAGREKLSLSMGGYVQWLAERYDELAKTLPEAHKKLRETLRSEISEAHPRTPDNTSVLILALQQFRDYSISLGAFGEEEATKRYEEAKNGILEAARAHTQATSGGSPADQFLRLLGSLFENGRVYVTDKATEGAPPNPEQLGWGTYEAGDDNEVWEGSVGEKAAEEDDAQKAIEYYHRGSSIGWADGQFLYLDKNIAYAEVNRFAQTGGIPFGIKPNALWSSLARSGKSIADADRTDTTARIKGKPKRVVQIPISAVIQKD